jgi:type IV pilus assembly protein PilQ
MIIKNGQLYKTAIIALMLLSGTLPAAINSSSKNEVIVKNVWVDVPLSQVFRDISVENGIIIATCPHVPDPMVSLDAGKGKALSECIDELITGQGLFVKKKSDKFYLIVCGDPECPSAMETVVSTPMYLNYINSKHLRESLPKSLQQYVTSGQRDNEVLIYAVPEISDRIVEIVKQLDVPQEQVMLEVLVVDLWEGTSDEFNLDWDILGPHTAFSMAKGVAGFAGLASYTSVAASNLVQLNLQLHALIENKKASIRSRPRVATINGEKAKIDVSLDEYYTIATDLYGTSLRTELEVIKSGVTLEMTPHIGEDGFITVDVQTEVSDVASRRNSSGSTSDGSSSDLPVIRRRKADTHVRVKEGDAIVIGGLIETQETTNHGKFPGLAEIPVVGGLFKSKADSTTKKEVMIFITPQIMKDNQVAFSDRNKMINGTEEVEKLRSPEFYAMEKDRNNKISQDEIQSLNQAVTMLDSGNNNQRNVNTVNNEMTPEQEKQMLQEAISLLAVDSDAGKENNKK